ncbi:DUF4194 domain-containing protein [Burkholderia cepacia]|uniref:DUF4194 domain-containing protein n=1 Tax=Burkholderia cepacia TaxID=292 RepID=UPI0009BFCB0B|nr:DUF4194 domain-containing protein [Burkholderia cepacia]
MSSINKRQTRHPIFRKMGSQADARPNDPDPADEIPEVDDEGPGELLDDDSESTARMDGGVEMPLFEGDTSTLPHEVRRAYALLLRGPSLDERHRKLWPVLIDHELRLRQLLHAAFLDLVIDREQKIAFARPAHIPDEDVPQLLREVRLTFVDSALVLHLRMMLVQAEAEGRRATVSRFEMIDHLKAYEASDNVDQTRFNRQVDGAIEKAKKYNFLRLIRNSGERFEISPVLKLVFSHDQIEELRRTYQDIRNQLGGRPLEGDGDLTNRSDSKSSGDPDDGHDIDEV